MAKYSDIRNQLDTGDIVLFSGKGHISSAIKWFTAGKWSHVGMVIRSSEWDMLLLWESTTLSNLKTIDNAHKEGVQTVFLSERVATYDGDIGVRRLSVERTPQMIEDLKAFRAMVKDRPYEESKWELIKSALDGPSFLENQEDLSSLFCSENGGRGLPAHGSFA